jgi:dolichyl-phosphate beta-glucosyltransferase
VEQDNSQDYRLSIVVPMYNEAPRLPASMPQFVAFVKSQPYSCEVIVVDDGSADDTPEVARRLLTELPAVRVIESRPNRGKGAALRVGMTASRGRFVLFTDADLSTPPDEIAKFWPWLRKDYDLVIGSRKMAGAVLTVRQPWWRERMGKVFTWLSDRIATRNISDVTCGFKIFSSRAAHDLFRRGRVDDFSFDAEILFLAQRRGYRIKEVPVSWHDERGTSVRVLRDAVKALRGLFRIRANYTLGRYGDLKTPPVTHEA